MKRFTSLKQACVTMTVAAAFLASPAAHAAASAQASVSNIHFTLVDLDAGDGVTPFLNWGGNNHNRISFINSEPWPYGKSYVGISGEPMDIGNGLELQDHGVTMSGVRDPNTGTGPWVGPVNFQPLQQRAYVNDPSGSYQYDREVEAFWRSSAAGGFLSARTKVIGVADLDVSVSGGEGSASAGLTFAPEGQTAFGEGLSIGSNATLHKHITFEFSNLSDSTLRVHATATSRAALSAVPEPGVVSLLLAGAGVAGLMARRRRA